MASIELMDVSLDYPILGVKSRSLKKKFLTIASGGFIDTNSSDFAIVNALNKINLKIVSGERIGLIGNNGAGKTTLLKLITGIYVPTYGSIKVDGTLASLVDVNFGIDPEATGRENIVFRCLLLGFSLEKIKEIESDVIEFSGLGDFIDLPTSTYSSGMNVRLAFSMSTIMQSDIIVMDEWLTVGDKYFEKKAEERLSKIVEKSDILVLTSHSMDLVKKVCNRVLLLENGKIIYDGSPDKVIQEYISASS